MKFFDLTHLILSKFREILTVEPLNMSRAMQNFLDFFDALEEHFGIFYNFYSNYRNTFLGFFSSSIFPFFFFFSIPTSSNFFSIIVFFDFIIFVVTCSKLQFLIYFSFASFI